LESGEILGENISVKEKYCAIHVVNIKKTREKSSRLNPEIEFWKPNRVSFPPAN